MYRKLLLILAALLFTLGFAGALQAAEPEDLIKYRQSVMKVIGGHMGAMALILRGKVDYTNHLQAHASGIATASKEVKDIFPEESAIGDTQAKQEIWDQTEKFSQAVEKLEQASAAFDTAVQGGDQAQIGAAMKELGGACKNCHDNFRQKKK